MQRISFLALCLSAAASASLFKRQVQCSDYTSEDCLDREGEYSEEVCMPTNSSGYPDFNAPCVAVQAITAQCIYGSAGLSLLTGNGYGDPTEEEPATLSNSTQRDCICESQFFAETLGCEDCYTAHGLAEIAGDVNVGLISSISSQYCAVTNTPTAGIADVLYSYATASSQSTSSASADTSSFSDPIGNKTAVSYYFTPSVTGSAAYVVAQATGSASTSGITGGSASSGSASSLSTSLRTSDGQIVPTAATNAQGSASGSGSASSSAATASTTGSSGAGKQEVAAVAGVIALAGVVAML